MCNFEIYCVCELQSLDKEVCTLRHIQRRKSSVQFMSQRLLPSETLDARQGYKFNITNCKLNTINPSSGTFKTSQTVAYSHCMGSRQIQGPGLMGPNVLYRKVQGRYRNHLSPVVKVQFPVPDQVPFPCSVNEPQCQIISAVFLSDTFFRL